VAAPREGGEREGPGVTRWKCARFDELTTREVHDIYQARLAVFVVEQNCPFQDVDGADPVSWHLVGRSPSPLGEGRGEGAILAYARLVPPGVKYAEPSIGRVLTTEAARRKGAGRELMTEALSRAQSLWPGSALRIGAQRYLEKFYGEFGFVRSSDVYIEDGIPHIEMFRA